MADSNKTFLVALYKDEEILLKAVKFIREKGVKITDALTPFPVHGLDEAMEIPETRLHTAGFLFGLTGFLVALISMIWISTSNWPINYGGKPALSIPTYIPITFELTVLFSAVGMVITYFIRNGLSVFNSTEVIDERITDDHFALIFDAAELTKEGREKVNDILKDSGAAEVKVSTMKKYKNLNGE